MKSIDHQKDTIAIIGLGYVGLPLGVRFAEDGFSVVGFDANVKKIKQYQDGIDMTHEVGACRLKSQTNLHFTSSVKDIEQANIYIVAVPTPVDEAHKPDLSMIESATSTVANCLKDGDVVVFESTVYPGLTEEVCVPILSDQSGLSYGKQFKVGYSPERVAPGDQKRTLEKLTKIVAGMDQETTDYLADLYGRIIEAGIYKATSIKVAEAAKVIENTQRDINIAFVNELATLCDAMGINVHDVLDAASSKWNFIPFKPGLVGGHCIGVDPYYLATKAQSMGMHPEMILAGRRINDGMAQYHADQIIKKLVTLDRPINKMKVCVLGITFKEDCPDIRNSKVVDLIKSLASYSLNITIVDPVADAKEVKHVYGYDLADLDDVTNMDAVIAVVPHKVFLSLDSEQIKSFYAHDKAVFYDIKGVFNKFFSRSEEMV